MNTSPLTARIALALLGPTILCGSTYLILAYLESREDGLGFNTATTEVDRSDVACIGAAMALGLVASHIYKKASAAGERGFHIGRTLADIPRSGPFWMALVVSPLVFGAVLGGVGDTDLTVAHFVFAFQNGFFWETVAAKPSGPPTLAVATTSDPSPTEPALPSATEE
ncbi:hypothetical protein ACWEKT_33355 [Nocardia takedensis]